MAKKLFLISLFVAFATTFIPFFSVHPFGKEEVVVYSIAMLAGAIALGFFCWKNREVLSEVTEEPSEKNWQIFLSTLKRNRSKEHSKDA